MSKLLGQFSSSWYPTACQQTKLFAFHTSHFLSPLLLFFPYSQIEEQIEAQYRAIQQRINELEPGKLRAYNELLARQRDLQDRVMHSEARLNDINGQVRT